MFATIQQYSFLDLLFNCSTNGHNLQDAPIHERILDLFLEAGK